MTTNAQIISNLKKELEQLEKLDSKRQKEIDEKREIMELKKKIKEKRRTPLKNLKEIGKNIGRVGSSITSEFDKLFADGEKKTQKPKPFDEVLRDLPQ